MIAKGSLLKTKTNTKNDVFGEVLWEVVQTGLPAPEKERRGQMDGVVCVMLGGSGPSARKGYRVVDSEFNIEKDIAAGVTTVVTESEKDELMSKYGLVASSAIGVNT